MGLIEKLQAKLELYRLEKKYARRSKRTTFTTGAQYVDGEYIYQSDSYSSSNASSPTSATSKNSMRQSWTPPKGGWGTGNSNQSRSSVS